MTSIENMEDVDKLEEPFKQHIPSDPIEDIDEGPLHCAMIETTEDLKYPQDCFSEEITCAFHIYLKTKPS